MRLARAMRWMYHLADRLLWGRLPLQLQRQSKEIAIKSVHRLLPGRVPPFSVEALMIDPRQHDPRWRELPDWARRDMGDAALRLAPELNPEAFAASSPRFASPPIYRTDAGRAFVSLRQQLPDNVDTLFIVPWLTRGGADLGTLHYVRACVESFGHSVAVLATEEHPSPWASRLPSGVPFIDAGPLLAPLDSLGGEQVAVLCRLLLQARPKRIHIVNSRLGWRVVQRHAVALRGFARLYASLFCDERDSSGFQTGLAVDYLRDTASSLDAVVVDNALTAREWVRLHGVNPTLFRVVRFPVSGSGRGLTVAHQCDGRPRLLWASRMDRQKRPELLIEIARRLPGVDIDVHGLSGEEVRFPWTKVMQEQPNLYLHGTFQSTSDLVDGRHVAFLYTSQWDGLPLVLLEAIAAGLPVIAPAVGGIPDLLESADLIADGEDIAAAYANRVMSLIADPALRLDVVRRQYERLQRHSWENFIRALGSVPHYTDDNSELAGGEDDASRCQS